MTILTGLLKKWGVTMAEYKDITKLKKEISDVKQELWGSSCQNRSYITGYVSALSYIEGMIASLLAADVQPVKHGRWQEVGGTPKGQMFHCSICHKVAYFPQPTRDKTWKKQCPYTYCPNCGAKMDGEESG